MRISSEKHETKRVGLALSGGGFRASLFHVGVLAQLAEFKKLKEIDTISTVSGGSIVGMIYYLHLKKFLESENRTIHDEDYLSIMKSVESEILEIVNNGFRTISLSGLHKFYTMTGDQLSQDLDERFRRILSRDRPLSVNDLTINPLYEGNQPPKMIVNATSLNNGELWVFSSEGNSHIKEHLEDMKGGKWKGYYKDSDYLNGFTIGKAVAASAAVPAFIKPVSIKKSKMNIQLVDGGMVDNLGTNSLLEDCNHLIISDGSKYLETKLRPSNYLFSVVIRTQNIFINAIVRSNLNNVDIDLEHIDMRYGLPRHMIITDQNKNKLNHGVNVSIQHYLSNMRTDLNSFSEIESKSLMLLGYRFALAEFSGMDALKNLHRSKIWPEENWQFISIVDQFNHPDADFLKELKVGKYRLFRRLRKKFIKLD
ncbi:patatin-like phospholipase family protein [Alkalibacillus silvisoli]|uniref:PNPLA domain-containing protein n=1 Tax=Alkalibacillus silvisoli TaxID=392823 RepID=A0ABN0ZZN3_9BACI